MAKHSIIREHVNSGGSPEELLQKFKNKAKQCWKRNAMGSNSNARVVLDYDAIHGVDRRIIDKETHKKKRLRRTTAKTKRPKKMAKTTTKYTKDFSQMRVVVNIFPSTCGATDKVVPAWVHFIF